jgi:hypothetical protein
LVSYVKEKKPERIVFESSHYINLRGKDMTSLFKLFGAISSLIYIFDFIKVVEQVQANQVKKLKSKIYNKELELENINYKAGRGGG